MIAYRSFPYDGSAAADEPGGALCFPRRWQGNGRHDNPEQYGCLYVTETPVSSIAEALALFRGADALLPSMLRSGSQPLALAGLVVPDNAQIVDLDDPGVLVTERLRPSLIATRNRVQTQRDALALFERHPDSVGLRWWSTLEASWLNLTLFDRAIPVLDLAEVRVLTLDDPIVLEAADALGIPVAG